MGEGALVAESGEGGDLRQWQPALVEQAAGGLKAAPAHELPGREAGLAAEAGAEVRLAEARLAGQVGHAQAAGEVGVDEALEVGQVEPGRRPGRLLGRRRGQAVVQAAQQGGGQAIPLVTIPPLRSSSSSRKRR